MFLFLTEEGLGVSFQTPNTVKQNEKKPESSPEGFITAKVKQSPQNAISCNSQPPRATILQPIVLEIWFFIGPGFLCSKCALFAVMARLAARESWGKSPGSKFQWIRNSYLA